MASEQAYRQRAGLITEQTPDAFREEVRQDRADPQALTQWFRPEDTGSVGQVERDVRAGRGARVVIR
jgi:hypothetical protein